MLETYVYPPDVAAALLSQWPAHGRPLPAPAVLTRFVAVGYQASLLREEDRPVQCHLLLHAEASPRVSLSPAMAAAYQLLAFRQPRPYSAQELRRLSPTTQRPGTLLGVEPTETGELTLTGFAFATQPWDRVDAPHEQAQLPPALFMQVAGPGRLAFFCGTQPVLTWQQGQLGTYGERALPSGWLRGLAEGATSGASNASPRPAEANRAFVHALASYGLQRCLTRVRERGHGGLLVIVPQAEAARLVDPAGLLRPKYGVQTNDFGVRYWDLLTRLVARSTTLGISTWLAYRQATDGELQHLHAELTQYAELLADLMAVDGALALDKQFGLLGFGVEITAPTPASPLVYRALDAEGTQRQAEAADSGGTRHRAAYRLCQAEAGCQAIVISQDGGIRLVCQQAGQVLFWNQPGQ